MTSTWPYRGSQRNQRIPDQCANDDVASGGDETTGVGASPVGDAEDSRGAEESEQQEHDVEDAADRVDDRGGSDDSDICFCGDVARLR